jgi:hypothetical protein
MVRRALMFAEVEIVAIDCVITENADKVKQSKEHATTVSATQVSYSRSNNLNNGEIVVIRAGRLK